MSLHPREGTIPFTVDGETHQTWYKIFGSELLNTGVAPLIGLHGGPGMAHDYLIPLADLSATRSVILYDQLGNARSTHLQHKPQSFWTIDLFIDELLNLVAHFGITTDGFFLLGHSWGGILAAELAVRRRPAHLKGIVLSNSLAAMALWGQSNMQLMAAFPSDVQGGLKGGFGDPRKYRAALEEVYKLHACRMEVQPKEVSAGGLDPIFGDRETGEGGDSTVSIAMNTGELKDWTIVDRLHEISVPCLVVNGKYDLAQDFVVQPFVDKIPKVKWVRYENASHLPMWEVREEYMEEVRVFLEGIEKQ
ncbi:proline iminopeptidase [Mycena galericulata]|nr:proline iminopeptidase [Mycena galericulata]